MYDLSKTAKLPLSVIRGNSKKRLQISDKMFNDFCRRISEGIHSETISVEDIKDTFTKTVPNKIGIQFRNIGKNFDKPDYNYDGMVSYMIRGKNRKVSGYVVMLPLDNSNKLLKLENLNILLHEMKHVYDYITNPKTLNIGFYIPAKLQHFYDEKIYPRDEIKLSKLALRTENAIKRRPFYTRINFLQYCRYELLGEINAFNAEKSYDIIKKEHPETIKKKKIFNDIEFFQVKEKLGIIENLLKKELTKLREENKTAYLK